MTKPEWTAEILEEARQLGDPVADKVVADLFAQGEVGAVDKLFSHLVTNDAPISSELPEVVQNYFKTTSTLPEWADFRKIHHAQQTFEQAGPIVLLLLGCASLPAAYACENGAHVLAITGRLTNGVERRIIETSQFVIDVMTRGGLEAGGSGIMSIQKVRLMHAAIRHLIENEPEWKENWNSDWGRPINQEDLTGTMLSFSTVVLDGLGHLNYPLEDVDREAYVHTWKVIGHMLGVEARLLPTDSENAWDLVNAIWDRQQYPGEVGRELMKALDDYINALVPHHHLGGVFSALTRTVIGKRLAGELNVAVTDAEGWIVDHFTRLTGGVGDAIDFSRATTHLAEVFGRAMLVGMQEYIRGGNRVKFQIPDHLQQPWLYVPTEPFTLHGQKSVLGGVLSVQESLVSQLIGGIRKRLGRVFPSLKREKIHEPGPEAHPDGWIQHQHWVDLLFCTYEVDPEAIRALIPKELTLDTFEGKAYVSVIPNRMHDWHWHFLPELGSGRRGFFEVNFRTYVNVAGTPGVFFLSVDASAPDFDVFLADTIFQLPYVGADVDFGRDSDGKFHVHSNRRPRAGFNPASFEGSWSVEGRPSLAEKGSFEYWAAERYAMFIRKKTGEILRGDIEHEPWLVTKEVSATIDRNSMLESVGLKASGEPHFMYSPGTQVKLWAIKKEQGAA